MNLTVRQRADIVGTYRWVSVSLMETLAGWVPTTPELEAKALFGRHVWDLAQHADQLGKRTAELRAPLHFNREASDGFLEFLEKLKNVSSTPARIHGVYELVLPYLADHFAGYLDNTDPLLDEPTVHILHRIGSDYSRMKSQRDDLFDERPDLVEADPEGTMVLERALAKTGEMVAAGDLEPAGNEK